MRGRVTSMGLMEVTGGTIKRLVCIGLCVGCVWAVAMKTFQADTPMSRVLEAYGNVDRFALGMKTTMQELFSQHGLEGWDIKIDRAVTRAGCCNYRLKTISISKYFITSPKTTYGSLWNILWHELAHALTPGHKHNEVWRAKAIELGSDGKTHCDHYHKYSYNGTCECPGTLKKFEYIHWRAYGVTLCIIATCILLVVLL